MHALMDRDGANVNSKDNHYRTFKISLTTVTASLNGGWVPETSRSFHY